MEILPVIFRKFKTLKDKGFYYLFLATGIGQALSFVQRIVLGRWLPQEDFGRYALIVESNTLFTALITLALPMGMIRFGLKERKLDFYFAGTFKVFLILSGISLAVYFMLRTEIAFFTDEITQKYCDIAILLAPLLAFFNYVARYLSAARKVSERAILTLLQRSIFFFFIVSGCWIALWQGTLVGYFGFILVFGLGILMKYRKPLMTQTKQFPYRKLIRFTSWSSLGTVCVNLTFFLILNFSERILDDLSLISQLMIAFTFTVIAKLFFGSINELLFPYFMEKGHLNEVIRLLVKSIIFYVLLSGIVLFISYFVVPILINLLLGEKYLAAIPLFKLVIVGEIIIGFSLLFELLLEVFGAVRFKAIFMVINLIVVLLILPPLLESYGVYGAAYAFIIFSIIRAIASLVGVLYQIRYNSWQDIQSAVL